MRGADMFRVGMDVFKADEFVRDLKQLVSKAIVETAKQVPLDLSRRVYAQVDPDGSAQKQNLPATQKQKVKKFGHAIPLLQEGVLADPSLYRVVHQVAVSRIKPPPQRAIPLVRLEQIGYRFWGISAEVKDFLAEALSRVIDYMDARRAAYVERTK